MAVTLVAREEFFRAIVAGVVEIDTSFGIGPWQALTTLFDLFDHKARGQRFCSRRHAQTRWAQIGVGTVWASILV